MQYLVIWSDGNKYGPADLALLNQWAAEGRVTPDTQLEPVDGSPRVRAGDLPGLVLPGTAAPAPAPQPAAAPAGQYFVLGPEGAKYGPADVPTLAKWMTENRLNSASELEDATTGQKIVAANVPGLSAQPAATYAQPTYQQQPFQQQPGQYPAGYSQAPRPAQGYTDPEAGKQEFTQSVIAAVVGFFCCPVIAPVFGIVRANQAKQLGHPNGQVMLIVNVVVLVLGVLGGLAQVAALATLGRGVTP